MQIFLFQKLLESLYLNVNYQTISNYSVLGNLQDPFVTKDEPLGTYKPYELGEELGIWINNSDGFTPAIGKVSTLKNR